MNKMLNAMKDYETKLIKESAEYLSMENAQLEEKIDKAIEDLNQLQEEIFGGDEYLNWIVSEIEKVKISLLGDNNE